MKSGTKIIKSWEPGRPREGAWIEIVDNKYHLRTSNRRPRMGAWIEMRIYYCDNTGSDVAPAWGRGLKLPLARS